MSFNQIRGVIITNEIKNLWNCTIEFGEYLRLLTLPPIYITIYIHTLYIYIIANRLAKILMPEGKKVLTDWGAVKNCRHCHHLIFIYAI